MRITFEVDWEGWRWSRRWERTVCWLLGHPRYVEPGTPQTAEAYLAFSWFSRGLRCIRCGARPPHYEEPLSTHSFSWSVKPFGQLSTHVHEEAS